MAAPDFKSAATLTPTILNAAFLPTGETAIYTVASAHGVKVATATVCNTTGSPVNVWISIVPNGGTAGDANRVVSGLTLAAGDTQTLRDYLSGTLMGPGDFISGHGSATGVSFVLTGAVAA